LIGRIRVGRWRFTVSMAPVLDCIGVNSKLKDGHHILMWDFDHRTLKQVETALRQVQRKYVLPPIYILQGSNMKSYIAYCFVRMSLHAVSLIIMDTMGVCWNYIKYGIYRGHYTLRISEKQGKRPILVTVLNGLDRPHSTIADLESFVKYETLMDDRFLKMVELDINKGKVKICPKVKKNDTLNG